MHTLAHISGCKVAVGTVEMHHIVMDRNGLQDLLSRILILILKVQFLNRLLLQIEQLLEACTILGNLMKTSDLLLKYRLNRKSAKDLSKLYYHGRICAKHNTSERYTSNGTCVACAKESVKSRVESGYFKELYKSSDLEQRKHSGKQRYANNKIKKIISARKWVLENPEKRRTISRAYKQKKRMGSTAYVLATRLSARIRSILLDLKITKRKKSIDFLGCSVAEFRDYFQSKFVGGMSWERISEIHIDHVIPISTAKTEEDVIRLSHYTNLQPLWAIDNLKKGSKISPEMVI